MKKLITLLLLTACQKTIDLQVGQCYSIKDYATVKILSLEDGVWLQWFKNGKLETRFGKIYWNRNEFERRAERIECPR